MPVNCPALILSLPLPQAQHPPPSAGRPLPTTSTYPIGASSPPINPQALNQMPTPIHLSPATAPVSQDVLSYPGSATSPVPTFPEITPTVAETGLPVAAGPDGPGPASGSLHDIKRASDFSGPRTGGLPATQTQPETYSQAPAYPSAEEEKRRLAASYSQHAPAPPAGPPPSTQPPQHNETAEEEKKRLEREERDRLLHGGSGPSVPPKDYKEDDLPPYQEPGL